MADWIAAVVSGSLALIGALGGQQLAARRDDRRWSRERDREELRYERERDRENTRWEREHQRFDEQRRHERALDYRDRLTAACVDFMKSYDRAHVSLLRIVARVNESNDATREFREAFQAAFEDAQKPLELIQLIASSQTADICFNKMNVLQDLYMTVERPMDERLKVASELRTARYEVQNAIRVELGVEDGPSSSGITQPPPSAPTS